MDEQKANETRHSGYVALIGRTNVGKSTFLNAVMEAKISIVSNKPQTTRKQILGIKTTDRGQIVFFDSPGVHVPHFRLNEQMMKGVHASLMDADVILYFIDISDAKKDDFILSMFNELEKPTFLVINKIDKFAKSKILDVINSYKDVFPWTEIVPISALKEINIDLMEDLIYKYLPENDNFYPAEETTLQTQKFYVSELIREKLLQLVEQELPFTTTVKTEEITDRGNVVYIRAEIYVESRSQKKIVVGKHGELVKEIGQLARVELEDHFDKKVYLDLFIKIVPDWRNSPTVLTDLEI
ncbi:MAG: GTPase Era [Candidatus Omnitrophota bacterium]